MHLRNFSLLSYLYWGVTTVGDLGNATGWIIAYREAVAKGRAAGSYIMVTGAKVNTPLKPGDAIDGGDAGGLETFTMGNSQMAYVTDQSAAGSAHRCTIAPGGTLVACLLVANNLNIAAGITLNSAKTVAYIASAGANTVYHCPVNASDGTLGLERMPSIAVAIEHVVH